MVKRAEPQAFSSREVEKDGGQNEIQRAEAHGNKDKRDQPPDLAPENIGGDKGQKGGGDAVGEQIQHKDKQIAPHDVTDQALYTQIGVVVAETGQPAGKGSHGRTSFWINS